MAAYDWTISDVDYNKMMITLDGIRARLAPMKVPLAKMIRNQPVKVKAFAQTDNGRFLREVYTMWSDLDNFFKSIGWIK